MLRHGACVAEWLFAICIFDSLFGIEILFGEVEKVGDKNSQTSKVRKCVHTQVMHKFLVFSISAVLSCLFIWRRWVAVIRWQPTSFGDSDDKLRNIWMYLLSVLWLFIELLFPQHGFVDTVFDKASVYLFVFNLDDYVKPKKCSHLIIIQIMKFRT